MSLLQKSPRFPEGLYACPFWGHETGAAAWLPRKLLARVIKRSINGRRIVRCRRGYLQSGVVVAQSNEKIPVFAGPTTVPSPLK